MSFPRAAAHLAAAVLAVAASMSTSTAAAPQAVSAAPAAPDRPSTYGEKSSRTTLEYTRRAKKYDQHAVGATREPAAEVWQVPEAAYAENPGNPLAGRRWGVYLGPQDQVWSPFLSSVGEEREQLAKIALRPRTKWFGGWIPDQQISSTVSRYIADSQAGDPTALVQMALFRMSPWEGEACERRSTPEERSSYKTWMRNVATAIGETPTLVVMQPDMPFFWCSPDRGAKSKLFRYATRILSELPNTDVYLDAGAADWCKKGTGQQPEHCADLLARVGIEHARGFALDSTHYTGPVENVLHGSEIVKALRKRGFGHKHFIVDTAKSGRPTMWPRVIPAAKGEKNDNSRTCTTRSMKRCVTLGIPPTVRTADDRWALPTEIRALARRHVDGFVWFGRPWLHYQADPFVMQRALDMGRSTPWPGPLADVHAPLLRGR
ncbi:glycoside hydrolase family 6 protein [Nocardioides solisilvae]|uniref:glycoside hydrolase family 6 protein n=1 Tax=Nocardioides solisilvae TaxID=1542435 RepID=UPI000D74D3A2|nr:glycoside hydrolase family 6 protein [Nocardioides solisilvae]